MLGLPALNPVTKSKTVEGDFLVFARLKETAYILARSSS